MKKLFALSLLTFISFISYAQKEPFLVKTFNANSIENLDVRTSGGSIEVTGVSGSRTVVEVFVKGNGSLSNSEIEDRLRDYTLEVKKEGGTLICFAKSNIKNNWKKGLSITFKIKSPRNVDTELLTSGGGIHLTNLHGDLNFSTSGGGLHLKDLSGDVYGRTSGGGIHVNNIQDRVDLSTSGGGIEVTDAEGEIKLRTSGGGIKLANMRGQIDAHTSGGSVKASNIEGELITGSSGGSIRLERIVGSVKANTSGGSISADILEVGDFLVLHTSAGGIDVNLPMDKGMDLNIRGGRVTMAYKNFEGDFDKNHVRGKINGGGANVDISASSGHVNIN
ncbi:DUF4097 family beta strand repeat-containing protein [Arcticibacterium luteifluviistationis]|uniref:DUF4097 domain-containing protein n=1 Tax=Arcticibacterium luteifluviistationis TaxID=1784714 RepID=A0A2Z4GE77_9BACT|nr:DUF4097 family beta strand repeat-containing protein [Arcticibacterium luteifluviistationis]AWV99494.1 hypothetical protein DJ013_15515 [Arcticibacterium luteifluviistationis]